MAKARTGYVKGCYRVKGQPSNSWGRGRDTRNDLKQEKRSVFEEWLDDQTHNGQSGYDEALKQEPDLTLRDYLNRVPIG